jgi:hypothetical protein
MGTTVRERQGPAEVPPWYSIAKLAWQLGLSATVVAACVPWIDALIAYAQRMTVAASPGRLSVQPTHLPGRGSLKQACMAPPTPETKSVAGRKLPV